VNYIKSIVQFVKRIHLAALCLLLILVSCKKHEVQPETSFTSKTSTFSIEHTSKNRSVGCAAFETAKPKFENENIKIYEIEFNLDKIPYEPVPALIGVHTNKIAGFYDLSRNTFNEFPPRCRTVADLDFVYRSILSSEEEKIDGYYLKHYKLGVKSTMASLGSSTSYKVDGETRTLFKVGGCIKPEHIEMFKTTPGLITWGFEYPKNALQSEEANLTFSESEQAGVGVFFKTDRGEESRHGVIILKKPYKQYVENGQKKIQLGTVLICVRK
jgi:hypothetical protein